MEYYAAIKNDEFVSFAGTWMNLETIILSKLTQEHKIKHRMFSLIDRVLLCSPGWSAVAQSRLTATSASRVPHMTVTLTAFKDPTEVQVTCRPKLHQNLWEVEPRINPFKFTRDLNVQSRLKTTDAGSCSVAQAKVQWCDLGSLAASTSQSQVILLPQLPEYLGLQSVCHHAQLITRQVLPCCPGWSRFPWLKQSVHLGLPVLRSQGAAGDRKKGPNPKHCEQTRGYQAFQGRSGKGRFANSKERSAPACQAEPSGAEARGSLRICWLQRVEGPARLELELFFFPSQAMSDGCVRQE
ncbi:retrotransposable element ORF2 protein [Plecturocebus cupreus]